jgi:hypothetical protein
MKISGPESYKLSCTPDGFIVTCSKGKNKFSGFAIQKQQKLYVVHASSEILYVGATTQSMQPRLRMGWRAKGESGYHGYPWRREQREVVLDVWLLDDAQNAKIDIETIEAEVVYLIRDGGQWPRYQHEIHFHISSQEHREAAEKIFQCYKILSLEAVGRCPGQEQLRPGAAGLSLRPMQAEAMTALLEHMKF